jgi:hypothetical protein
MYDILQQLRPIPTVTLNIELYCYPTFLSHIIRTKIERIIIVSLEEYFCSVLSVSFLYYQP